MAARRSNAFYGTRFDDQIVEAIKAGTSLAQISFKLGVSAYFVRGRGLAHGLADQIYKNGCAAKASASVGGGYGAGRWRAMITGLGAAPGDRLVSDVARSLRTRPAELSDAAIAALHERGVTVDELCEGTRRLPCMIIRAVREAARCS